MYSTHIPVFISLLDMTRKHPNSDGNDDNFNINYLMRVLGKSDYLISSSIRELIALPKKNVLFS
jgi:hypothetical protein